MLYHVKRNINYNFNYYDEYFATEKIDNTYRIVRFIANLR